MRIRLLTMTLIVACTPAFAKAQGTSDLKRNEFGLWCGYAPVSSQLLGTTTDHQLIVAGLHFGRVLKTSRRLSFDYTLGIVPVVAMRQPANSGHEVVYGGGVSPIGFRLGYRLRNRSQVFVASTAGFVASVRPIPVDEPGGTQFNFTFDYFQVGYRHFSEAGNRAWTLGYKIQHISNAYRSNINPGVDENVFFVGYSFYR